MLDRENLEKEQNSIKKFDVREIEKINIRLNNYLNDMNSNYLRVISTPKVHLKPL